MIRFFKVLPIFSKHIPRRYFWERKLSITVNYKGGVNMVVKISCSLRVLILFQGFFDKPDKIHLFPFITFVNKIM